MAIIKEYMQDECKIIVHDDYICTPEETEKIIDNISRIIYSDLQSREIRMERRKLENEPPRNG